MKSSIKILAIVTLGFVTVSKASVKEVFEPQLESEQLIAAVVTEKHFEDSLTLNVETFYFSPSNVLSAYNSTIEEIVKENNEIIEAKKEEYQPLYLDRTILDIIAEDNQVIESTVSTASYPLDFEKINNNVNSFPQFQNKASLKTEEIKL